MKDAPLEKIVITGGSLVLGEGKKSKLSNITSPLEINFFHSGYLKGHRTAIHFFIKDEVEYLQLASINEIQDHIPNLTVSNKYAFKTGELIGIVAGTINGCIIYPDYRTYIAKHQQN